MTRTLLLLTLGALFAGGLWALAHHGPSHLTGAGWGEDVTP